jgi:hypothetical protein
MGGTLDFIEDHSVARGFSGQAGAAAAREGAEGQVAASREALALLRGDLNPFKRLGLNQIGGISSLSSNPAAQQALRMGTPGFSELQALSNDPEAQQRARMNTPGFSEFQALSTDAGTQANFLQNNPVFNSLMEQSRKDIFANQAAGGKLGSTGTDELLQSRFLEQGNNLINQQLQRSGGALATGQDLLNQQIGRQGNIFATGQNVVDQQLNRQLPLLNIGQASAAQVGAGGSELLTGIGNAQAAGGIGAANSLAQGSQNVAGLATTIASLFSDERLKDDVVQIDNYNGIPVYTWAWNEEAKKLGKTGFGIGHIAQDLQITHPHLVGTDEATGYMFVNYGTDETVEATEWL